MMSDHVAPAAHAEPSSGAGTLIGCFLDDGAHAHLPADSTLITGRMGSGKSEVAGRLVRAQGRRGDVCWVADWPGGTRYIYGDTAGRYACTAAATRMLVDDAVAAVQQRRNAAGRSASPLLLTLDTVDRYDSATVDLLCRLAEDGPTVGVHLTVVTRRPQSLPHDLVDLFPTRFVLGFDRFTPEARAASVLLDGAVSARRIDRLAQFDGFLRTSGGVRPVRLLPVEVGR
jgi:hypothetical protein